MTTSPTSLMATSPPTKKPEKRGHSAARLTEAAADRSFFGLRPLWTPQVCGYTAALGK
jgi:hypothetical protein